MALGTVAQNRGAVRGIVLGQEVDRITLDGQGTATINGDPSAFTVTVRGRGITIRGFTITGGLQGIAVLDGGSAVIDGNTIQLARTACCSKYPRLVFGNTSSDTVV